MVSLVNINPFNALVIVHEGLPKTPDASHTDSMGFPARLMDM